MESSSTTAPVAVTGDPGLADQLHRLAAAAGVPLQVVDQVEKVPGPLTARPALLADEAAAASLLTRWTEPRIRTALVAVAPPSDTVWRRAVALRSERVLTLPADRDDLLEWLVDVTDAPRANATVVGVIGGCGGAGASTLAAGLARAAVRHRGAEVFLVDLDGLGGGLELLLGCEDVPGLRWADVTATRGRISPAALRDAVPRDDGVWVLSCSGDAAADLTDAMVGAVLQATRRAADLVLVDLPRQLDPAAAAALEAVDTLLLVVTADVRGAAGAQRVLSTARDLCDDVRLVVRHRRPRSVLPDTLAESLGVPLGGQVPEVRGLERAVCEGLGPPAHGPLGRACRRLLTGVVAGGGTS